jgi:hypothetical protein
MMGRFPDAIDMIRFYKEARPPYKRQAQQLVRTCCTADCVQ